jgi:hypothetical protein
MRPLITAEPMLRAGSPETVAASNFTGCCAVAPDVNPARRIADRNFVELNQLIRVQAVAIVALSSRLAGTSVFTKIGGLA